MRYNINKRTSTKSERRVYEVLKELHIPFRHRWIVEGMEIDFLIGSVALEIDGHSQNPERNHKLVGAGLTPLHLTNEGTLDQNYLKELLLNL